MIPTLKGFSNFIIVSQSEIDGKGMIIGKRDEDILVKFYDIVGDNTVSKESEIIIPARFVPHLSRTFVEELVRRMDKAKRLLG